MTAYLKLAWRNIWRNKRRTLITAASIFFAVFFALLMRSFQLGSYSHWTSAIIESYTGYLQIQHNDFWTEKSINNTMEYTQRVHDLVDEDENIRKAVPRLESGALASYKAETKVALIIGIDTEAEAEMSDFENKLVKYKFTDESYDKMKQAGISDSVVNQLQRVNKAAFSHLGKLELEVRNVLKNGGFEEYKAQILEATKFDNSTITNSDDGILIADRLADYLEIGVGDTLILTGFGYHGITAEGLFPVKGIIKFPAPDLDKSLIYMPLNLSQEFYSAPGRITSLSIDLKKTGDSEIEKTKLRLQEKLNGDYTVKDWKQLNELIMRQIEMDNQQGIIMLALLYIIIGFGIFGTVLMMTSERKREFGVMVAVGMQKYKLGGIVTLEMIFIGIIGIIAGIIVSLPIIYYYHINPIQLTGDMATTIENYGIAAVMPFAWEIGFFINQALVIVALVIVASFYPIYSITRIKAVKAMRA